MWDDDMKKLSGLLAAAMMLGFGGASQAALVGDEVTCSTDNMAVACSVPFTEVEDPGVEFSFISNTFFTFDLSNTGLLATFDSAFTPLPNFSITIGDLDFSSGDELQGFANFQQDQGFSGLSDTDITTTADSFTIDLRDVSSSADDQTFSFDFVTGPATVVPLPAAVWLLGGALFLLGAGRRLSKAA